jgi:Skp family chaperone for outer membrane proteins
VAAAGAVVLLMGAASARAELKAGVVDIIKVTQDYSRIKEAENDLQDEQSKLAAEADVRKRDLKVLLDRKNNLNKDTNDWKKASDDLMEATINFQGWYFLQQARIEVKHRAILLDIYHQVLDAVARVAAQKKMDLVFTKAFLLPPTIDLERAAGLEDMQNRIVNQRMLFPDPATIPDLTDDVVKLLNAEWKPKSPAVPPRPLPVPLPGTPRPSPLPPPGTPRPLPSPPLPSPAPGGR